MRVWDIEQRGYAETLYGHQEAVTALDALCDDLVLSGSEDRSVRLWKVAEETQLLFRHRAEGVLDQLQHPLQVMSARVDELRRSRREELEVAAEEGREMANPNDGIVVGPGAARL